MNCPDCQRGTVLVLRGKSEGQVRPYGGISFLTNPEKYFDKVPCQRCHGLGIVYCSNGPDAAQADTFYGGPTHTGKVLPTHA